MTNPTGPRDGSPSSADDSPTEPVPAVPGGTAVPSGVPTYAYPPSAAPEPMQPPARAYADGQGWAPAGGNPYAPVATAPVAAPVKPRQTGGSRILSVALFGAVLIAAVGISFAAGRASVDQSGAGSTANAPQAQAPAGNGAQPTNPAQPTDPNANTGNGANPGGNGFGFGNGNPNRGSGNGNGPVGRLFGGAGGPVVTGTVESVTSDSITIKTARGAEITLGLDGSTTYHQLADAQPSDVKSGDTVQVQVDGFGGAGQSGNGASLGTAGSVTVVP